MENNHLAGHISTYSKAAYLDLPHYPSRFLYADGAYVHGQVAGEGSQTHRYIDFTASLGAILRGYLPLQYSGVPPVLPGPHSSEEAAAELFCAQTGWEQVRWCKNGSDATEAAVRGARYLTNRRRILCNSYHGSHSDLVTATEGKRGGVLPNAQMHLTAVIHPEQILLEVQD